MLPTFQVFSRFVKVSVETHLESGAMTLNRIGYLYPKIDFLHGDARLLNIVNVSILKL